MRVSKVHLAKKATALLLGVLFVIALDQGFKFLLQRFLVEPIEVTGFFRLGLSYNPGIAFGVNLPYPAIEILSLAIILWLAVYFLFAYRLFWERGLALIFILGGGISNFLERGITGSVRDFLSFSFWPSFNVADIAIVGGVILFIISLCLRRNITLR